MRAPQPNFRLGTIIDPRTQQITAYTITNLFGRADRIIWMDGRPRPSTYAEHKWQGFSTGAWLPGGVLTVTTTHIKHSFMQRNGLPISPYALMTEFYSRHGEYLSLTIMVDLQRGGSVQGVLNALNQILDIAVPEFNNQGGTLIVPGHGRICNESDVAEYRDMITIVRDRIQAMVEKGMTMAEVKAAAPAKDYDPLYSTPGWTTDMFVETVYTDLSKRHKTGN
jgi:hypothetical protein